MKKLQEKTIDFKELYKDYFNLDSKIASYGNTCFEDLEEAQDLINKAKDKAEGKSGFEEDIAFLYCYKLVFKMAAHFFWVFLGPNSKSRQIRIENDAFYDYAGLCNEAMYKALKKFDPMKAKTPEELKGGLQFYFKGYIEAETKKYNKAYNMHGMSGYGANDAQDDIQVINPDGLDNDGNKSAWDSYVSNNEDALGSDVNFADTWRKLAADKELHGKKPWNKMLASILSGNSVEDVATEFGVSKNTVREKFYSTKHNRENGSKGLLADLCEKYGIDMDDLANNLRSNTAFIVNTLSK